jgi:hypothetical protein
MKKPKKDEGGAASRLDRIGKWAAVSETQACHPLDGPAKMAKEDRDHEGIRLLSRKNFTKETVQDCQDSCLRSANCMSIDYFPESKICNWYDGVCSEAALQANANPDKWFSWGANPEKGSSWRVELERFKSGLTMAEMKRFGEWTPISANMSCERNGDGIEPDFMIKAADLNDCQQHCEKRSQCVAVDFYQETKHCNQYTEACQTPRGSNDGASSYRIERKWLQWKAIDRSRACEENYEGIGHIAHRLNVPEMSTCKDMCTRKADCIAFDFFRDQGHCSLYNEACTGPLSDRHGASSYEMVRKDNMGADQKTKADSGFEVQKGLKLRLY